MRALRYRFDVRIVDVAIVKTLGALADREGRHVMLASHDGDFAPLLAPPFAGDRRRVGVVLREFTSGGLMELAAQGLWFHDLEDDAGPFAVALPRLRVIPIEDFDPRTCSADPRRRQRHGIPERARSRLRAAAARWARRRSTARRPRAA